jgi:hypothetical protein
MVVEFTNTPEDLKAFTSYHYEHSPIARRQRLVAQLLMTFAFLVAFGVTLLVLGSGRSGVSPVTCMAFAIIGSLGAGLIFVTSRSSIARGRVRNIEKMYQEGKNTALYEQHSVALDADGVRQKSPSAESFIRWSSIEKVALTDTHLFLYGSAVSAFAIPRRAFADDVQWNEFASLAQRYHADSRQQSA